MNNKLLKPLLTSFLIAIAFCAPVARSSAQEAARSAPSGENAAAVRWAESDEFRALVAQPAGIVKALVRDEKVRARDIANLPQWIQESRVTDPKTIKALRERLRPLFDLVKDASDIEIFLYRSDDPFIALGEKSLLVITTGTLKFFSDSELRASVAHEITHLYFYDDYLDAYLNKKASVIKLIELKCDAMGTALSARFGEKPDTLIRAVRRIVSYQQKAGLVDANMAAMTPTLAARETLSESVVRIVKSQSLAYKP